MDTSAITTICPNCKKKISIDQALIHQFEAQVLASSDEKHKKEIEEAVKIAEQNVGNKVQEEFKLQLLKLQKENEEEKERNKKLLAQMDELLDEIKKLRVRDEERNLEMKKKMIEQENKIRQDARKQIEEENQLKSLEKDKKLEDALKQLEEMKNKIQQGSQQSQGEVLELALEKMLVKEFPQDIITEVKKGERGADIIQEVVDKRARRCGIILWETKNAKWDNTWIGKLKDNQRAKNAELAVLVAVNKPDWFDTFTYKEGIWFSTLQFAIPLAFALRFDLVRINHERASSEGKEEKKDILYEYFKGTEFKHRVEGIVEAFRALQEDLEKERRWFNGKWARQEKSMRKVLDQTYGMYGDLQGIMGRTLPEIKLLELPNEEDNLPLSEVKSLEFEEVISEDDNTSV